MTDRTVARELARRSLGRGDPSGWFDELYARAEREPEIVPWANGVPNPLLVDWTPRRFESRPRSAALVVGCGYGDDAEWLASRGYAVTAFDVSSTAITAARRRFPRSSVDYRVADVLDPPASWTGAFDLVVESFTLQVLPPPVRARAADRIAGFAKRCLLLISRARDPGAPPGPLPWPLTRPEVEAIAGRTPGLAIVSFEDFVDHETPPVRRFRVEFARR
jgi:SAM-dependent methyltransferase